MLKTFVRNWFQEALDIANGKNIKVKKEHVFAVVQQHTLLAQKTEKLVTFFKNQHGDVVAKRERELNGKASAPKGTC